MQILFFDKMPTGRSIGTLHLAIAMVCIVWGGMLLIGFGKTEHMESEMRQYRLVKPVKTETTQLVYNPFALASDNTALAKKPTITDWIVTDVEFEKNYNNRSILDNLLHKSTPTGQSALSLVEVRRIFEALRPMTLALAHYYDQNKQWPNKLEDVGVDMLPQHIGTYSLTTRGKLTIEIRGNTGLIHLSPKSLLKPIKWFCQTTLQNHLLGKGSNRLCIHNRTLH